MLGLGRKFLLGVQDSPTLVPQGGGLTQVGRGAGYSGMVASDARMGFCVIHSSGVWRQSPGHLYTALWTQNASTSLVSLVRVFQRGTRLLQKAPQPLGESEPESAFLGQFLFKKGCSFLEAKSWGRLWWKYFAITSLQCGPLLCR